MTGEPPVRSPKVRNILITVVVALLVVASLVYYGGIGPFHLTMHEGSHTSLDTTFVTQTSLDTNFVTHFYYNIAINYSGSWRLVYWAQNGTVTQQNSKGNLTYGNKLTGHTWMLYNVVGNQTGSGNHETTIVTYGVGYVENTLCAKATKLDTHNDLTLTLGLVEQGNSTTASNPSAEVCATFGV